MLATLQKRVLPNVCLLQIDSEQKVLQKLEVRLFFIARSEITLEFSGPKNVENPKSPRFKILNIKIFYLPDTFKRYKKSDPPHVGSLNRYCISKSIFGIFWWQNFWKWIFPYSKKCIFVNYIFIHIYILKISQIEFEISI